MVDWNGVAQELISKEVDEMSDEQFLTKVKLIIAGKVTNVAKQIEKK